MPKDATHSVLLQLPERLHRKFVKESGRLTVRTGQRVTVTGLIRDILNNHFTKKTDGA